MIVFIKLIGCFVITNNVRDKMKGEKVQNGDKGDKGKHEDNSNLGKKCVCCDLGNKGDFNKEEDDGK